MIQTENTYMDHRFCQELDDPNFTPGSNPAQEMISLPIFTAEDPLCVGKDSLANYPRAILHIINKKQNNQSSNLSSVNEETRDKYLKSQKFTYQDTE